MKKVVFLGSIAMFFVAGSSSALTITSTAFDPATPAGERVVANFDGLLAAGVTETDTGDTLLRTGTTQGLAAAPYGDTTQYKAIEPGGAAVFSFVGYEASHKVSDVSFYWGSTDSYNAVTFLNTSLQPILTIGGSNLPPANGDQSSALSNRLVKFSNLPTGFGGLKFTSTGVAFEFDNLAASAALPGGGLQGAVPEPATWSIMLAGFGMVGAATRRRRVALTA